MNLTNAHRQFLQHRAALGPPNAPQFLPRLAGLWSLIGTVPPIAAETARLRDLGIALIKKATPHELPPAKSLDDIHAVGFRILEGIAKASSSSDDFGHLIEGDLDRIGFSHPYVQPAYEIFVKSTLDAIESLLAAEVQSGGEIKLAPHHPPEITESLRRFRRDHPVPEQCFFVMMRFASSDAHLEIVQAIRETLQPFGLVGLRADDKEYHEELWPNVRTYMHGCQYGIAVFERLETDDFNPNVSLEVGYMMASRKQVCLLKDKTLKSLHTDLVGKLYRSFDPQNPTKSIPEQLKAWLTDKDIISR